MANDVPVLDQQGAGSQPVFSQGGIDSPFAWDGMTSFGGGMVSYAKASGLGTDQCALLYDATIHVTGQARKRRGLNDIKFPDGPIVANKTVQALKWYDTSTNDRMLAVINGNIYSFDQSTGVWSLYITAGITNTDENVSVVQLSDNIYWTDSTKTGIRKWKWDTQAVTTVTGSPVATILMSVSLRLAAAGMVAYPNTLWFSDYLNGDSWPAIQAIGIGEDGDPITAIKKWQKYFLIVAKAQSIYMVDANPGYGMVSAFPVLEIHASIGCVSKRTMCQLGQDMFFLSKNGVMRVTPQDATDTNVLVPLPVSQPVQDVIQSIRWAFAYKSCATSYGNHYILSVPVNSNDPDTILAYSNITSSWVGIWRKINAIDFCEQPFQGQTRLLVGDITGRVLESRDYIQEIQESPADFTDAGTDIECIVRSRAMTFNDGMSTKTPYYLECEFLSKDGTIEVYAILDGGDPTLLEGGKFALSTAIRLPFYLPVFFVKPQWVKKKFPLFPLGQFRDIQIEVRGKTGNMILRSMTLSCQIDSVNFNTAIEIR